ncbi:MAG: endolytic transglycosylase MltG [Xanthomonadaceae bacterium]|nr:endolytic transglycosylase MltG [Xanthomonadaceae bacterium]
MMRLLGVLLVLAAALSAYAAWDAHRVLHQTLQVDVRGAPLEVRPGDTLSGVAAELAGAGVLRAPRRLVWAARLSGREVGIQVGEYELQPGMRANELVDLLAAGRTVLHAMTVVEGWTFGQLRAALAAHPALVVTLDGVDDDELMVRLDMPGEHPEGRFYPDTYLFPRGTTDFAFLERALRTMNAHLASAWERRDVGLPYRNPYEALIMASIIEREARIKTERPQIAGVFIRRLQLGMRLQTDPTVMYGVSPDFRDRLRTVHLRTDTPYNTYTRHGLPPTPIALPGESSLSAAMHPADGDALFFVSRGDGSHHFSATLEEHNRAVARYVLGRREDGN